MVNPEADAADPEALAVAWPVLSFRPTPRSRRRLEPSTPIAQPYLDLPPVTPAAPTSSHRAAAEGPVGNASGSDNDEEDWSYPALDLTASREEAARILQAKRTGAEHHQELDQAEKSDAATKALVTDFAASIDEAASDASSEHESWSYPPLIVSPASPPRQDLQPSNAAVSRPSSQLPTSDGLLAVPTRLPSAPLSLTASPAAILIHGEASLGPSANSTGDEIPLQGLPACSKIQPPEGSMHDPLLVMFSNAAYLTARRSGNSEDSAGSEGREPADGMWFDHTPADLSKAPAANSIDRASSRLELGERTLTSLQDFELIPGSSDSAAESDPETADPFTYQADQQQQGLNRIHSHSSSSTHQSLAPDPQPSSLQLTEPEAPDQSQEGQGALDYRPDGPSTNPILSLLSFQLPSLASGNSAWAAMPMTGEAEAFRDSISHRHVSPAELEEQPTHAEMTNLATSTEAQGPASQQSTSHQHPRNPLDDPAPDHEPTSHRAPFQTGPVHQVSRLATIKARLLPRSSSAAATRVHSQSRPASSLSKAPAGAAGWSPRMTKVSKASVWAGVMSNGKIKAVWSNT